MPYFMHAADFFKDYLNAQITGFLVAVEVGTPQAQK